MQDEGSQLVALALAAAPLDGPGRALAGPVRRARRQGGAARRAGGRARRPRWWPNERQPHRGGLVARALRGADGVAGRRRRRRHPPAVGARHVRPGAGRRALHRPRRPAPAARGALAPQPEDLPTPGPAPAGAAGRRRPRPGARPAAWCSTRPAHRSSPRPPGSVEPSLADAHRRDARGRRRPAAGRPDCAGPLPGTVQLWPHRHGTDAMFLALLRRLRLTEGRPRRAPPGVGPVGTSALERPPCTRPRMRIAPACGTGCSRQRLGLRRRHSGSAVSPPRAGCLAGARSAPRRVPQCPVRSVGEEVAQVAPPGCRGTPSSAAQLEVLPGGLAQAPVTDLEDRGAGHARRGRGSGSRRGPGPPASTTSWSTATRPSVEENDSAASGSSRQ